MALRDEFKKERSALRDKPFKEKFRFFWTYYKWHALIWLVGLIFLGIFIYNKITAPVYLLNGIFLNADDKGEDASSALADSFTDTCAIDKGGKIIRFDTSLIYNPGDEKSSKDNYNSCQAIIKQRNENNLDFVAGPVESMQDLAYNSIFADLRKVLSEDEINLYEPYFLYVDAEVIEEFNQAYEDKKDTSSVKFPDPKDKDQMKEPVPVMIDISNRENLFGIYHEGSGRLAFSILDAGSGQDTLKKFIKYIMKQEDA